MYVRVYTYMYIYIYTHIYIYTYIYMACIYVPKCERRLTRV